MKHILLIDDHPIFLQGTKLILEALSPVLKISTAIDFYVAKQMLKNEMPDLLLLDLMLSDENGLICLKELVAHYPALHIAILSSSEEDKNIKNAISCGAQGYLFKTYRSETLLTLINQLLNGKKTFPKSFALRQYASKKNDKGYLTQRQTEILQLVSDGDSNKKIANSLFISEGTVKQHLSTIFKVLNVNNRIEASQCVIHAGG